MYPTNNGVQVCLFTGICSFFLLTGCENAPLRTYPVCGQVFVNGQPAAGATVIFCPQGGPPPFQRERPWGVTDEQGVFSLTTFEKDDGAAAGDYQVLIRWPPPRRREEDSDRTPIGPDRLGGHFADRQRSPLVATVLAEKTMVPPFRLRIRTPPRHAAQAPSVPTYQ